MTSEIEFVVKMLHKDCKTRRPYAALLLLFFVKFLILYSIKGMSIIYDSLVSYI